MSGTIPLSMTQQFDVYGKPLAGGQLYIMQAGTVSTPQDAFQDTALTIKQPYPMTLDAAGRVPQFFLADGTVKIRLQDKTGVVQLAADSVLVIVPSAGGGGGGAVDPTQLIQTGNMIFRHGVGALAGYVRLNNLTIGSATSGATERANADCQNLFQFLWPDTSLVVSGGRGANAAADWTANKNLSLPDWRGYAPAGLADMGNAPTTVLTAAFFGSSPTVLGAIGGAQGIALVEAELPVITPLVNTLTASFTLNALIPVRSFANSGSNVPSQISLASNIGVDAGTLSAPVSGSITPALTIRAFGGGASHKNLGPRKLVTFYMKL